MAVQRKIDPGVDNNNQRLINVATPTAASDASTKSYVDQLIQGLQWHGDVIAAPTTNITVSNPGTAVFDGVTVSSGQRLLLLNQTTASENGIYIFNGSGAALTRSADANTAAGLQSAVVSVEQGTTNANTVWLQTADNITVGTTALAWTKLNNVGITYTGGNGISISGSTISAALAASGGLTFSGGSLALDTTIAVRKYTTTIAVATGSQTITHNLGSQYAMVQVFDTADSYRTVELDTTRPTANTVVFNLAGTYTANQLACVVQV